MAARTAGRETLAPGDGVVFFAPGLYPAAHGDGPRVPHLSQVVRRQRRSITAAAVEDDRGVAIGDQGLDVALQHAASDMTRAPGVVDRELAVLAHVDEVKGFPTVETALHVGDGAFDD